jgi:AbiU2
VAEESAEQVRARHIRDMGHELGAVYHALWNEVAWLHTKWNQYRQLYAHSPERVSFLNTVAGQFFAVVQQTLMDDILLHLTRLTDPPRSVGKDNLTLLTLPELPIGPALASELKGLVQAAHRACKSMRSSRNQRIAHTDLSSALTSTFDPHPKRIEVEAALGAVRAVLNRLEMHYWQSETLYQDVLPAGLEAESLVYYLRKGSQARKRQMERLVQAKPLPEDLEPEDEGLIQAERAESWMRSPACRSSKGTARRS